jgi:methyl acetate hydrolase
MADALRKAADTILRHATEWMGGVPGVVAMATDRAGNIYEGAFGRRALGRDERMTADTVFAIFSATKPLAAICAMQLVEEGRIRLEDPARLYVPEIAELQVLEGFDDAGQPKTRPPKREITIDHLMLHTAGLGYEIFNADDFRFRAARKIPSPESCSFAAFRTVLLHDPGERWTYGANIDWLGRVVEQQRGKRLGEVMKERLLAPLEMHDTAFAMTPSMRARRATIHERAADGRLTSLPDLELPQPPEMDCGGHGLYATVGDYMKFIRMLLNDGAGPGGRVLKAETVARLSQDGLGALSSGGWGAAVPTRANEGEFFPGLAKGWAYSFMLNREPAPTGRPAGSLMWAGSANLYFWIDRKTRVGGFWATQVLPFLDIASYPGFLEFETAVYRTLAR